MKRVKEVIKHTLASHVAISHSGDAGGQTTQRSCAPAAAPSQPVAGRHVRLAL